MSIAAGVTEATFEIETVPDDIYEPDETFTVTLTAATASQGSIYNPTIGTDKTATVTIDNDEDVPTVFLSSATYETTEPFQHSYLDLVVETAPWTSISETQHESWHCRWTGLFAPNQFRCRVQWLQRHSYPRYCDHV